MEPVILRAWNTDPKKFSPLEKRKAKRKTFLSLAVDVFSDDRTAHITVVGVYSIVPILVLLPRKVQVFPWTSVVVADVASLQGWHKKSSGIGKLLSLANELALCLFVVGRGRSQFSPSRVKKVNLLGSSASGPHPKREVTSITHFAHTSFSNLAYQDVYTYGFKVY